MVFHEWAFKLKVYGLRGKSLKTSVALISCRLIVLLKVNGLKKVNPVFLGIK
jgi:hypothetical protein